MLRREKGFTLIELLIVVAIIGIIAAIAVPNLLTAIQRSKQKRTMADLRAIGTALGSYQTDYDFYPTVAATTDFSYIQIGGATVGPTYYKGSVNDGWGNTYRYTSTGPSYTLCSQGKNTVATGADFNADIMHIDGAMIEAAPTNSCG